MSDLRELYQSVIIDHSRHPHNFGELIGATHQQQGYNPLCGDKVTMYLQVVDDTVQQAKFDGCGCAISIATASLMTDAVRGKTITEVQSMFEQFRSLVTGEKKEVTGLGKLAVLGGVAEYPMRVKCATLAWHTLSAALQEQSNAVTTE